MQQLTQPEHGKEPERRGRRCARELSRYQCRDLQDGWLVSREGKHRMDQ